MRVLLLPFMEVSKTQGIMLMSTCATIGLVVLILFVSLMNRWTSWKSLRCRFCEDYKIPHTRDLFCGIILSGILKTEHLFAFWDPAITPARKLTAGNFDHDQDRPHFSTVECDSSHDQIVEELWRKRLSKKVLDI